MPIKVDYSETMDSIIDGLIRHNKDEIIGGMLIKKRLTIYQLEDKKKTEEHIRSYVSQTAYSILIQLKKQLGSNFQIFQEDEEVMTDI